MQPRFLLTLAAIASIGFSVLASGPAMAHDRHAIHPQQRSPLWMPQPAPQAQWGQHHDHRPPSWAEPRGHHYGHERHYQRHDQRQWGHWGHHEPRRHAGRNHHQGWQRHWDSDD